MVEVHEPRAKVETSDNGARQQPNVIVGIPSGLVEVQRLTIRVAAQVVLREWRSDVGTV